MPIIQQTIRISFGPQVAPVAQVITASVDQIREFTLAIPGVPPAPDQPNSAPAKGKKKMNAKPAQKRIQYATFKPELSNVDFVAIYDAGEGAGVHVGLGKQKPSLLKEPVILTKAAARTFGKKAVVNLTNSQPISRSLVMVVGSNLGKNEKSIELKSTKS